MEEADRFLPGGRYYQAPLTDEQLSRLDHNAKSGAAVSKTTAGPA